MKSSNFIALSLLLLALSCDKETLPKTGVDGVTPMPKAIDIGTIVNGKNIKWASFNLGASNEYEEGDVYAWGETYTKESFTWDNYSYSPEMFKFTKYVTSARYWSGVGRPDGLTTLVSSDDVASVKLGGKWRMPTRDDIEALLSLQYDSDYIFQVDDERCYDNFPDSPGGFSTHTDFLIRITRKSTGANLSLPHTCFWSSSLDVDYPSGADCLTTYESLITIDPNDERTITKPVFKLYLRDRYRPAFIRPVTE